MKFVSVDTRFFFDDEVVGVVHPFDVVEMFPEVTWIQRLWRILEAEVEDRRWLAYIADLGRVDRKELAVLLHVDGSSEGPHVIVVAQFPASEFRPPCFDHGARSSGTPIGFSAGFDRFDLVLQILHEDCSGFDGTPGRWSNVAPEDGRIESLQNERMAPL